MKCAHIPWPRDTWIYQDSLPLHINKHVQNTHIYTHKIIVPKLKVELHTNLQAKQCQKKITYYMNSKTIKEKNIKRNKVHKSKISILYQLMYTAQQINSSLFHRNYIYVCLTNTLCHNVIHGGSALSPTCTALAIILLLFICLSPTL